MIAVCNKCGTAYDDAGRWTICPHTPLGFPVDDLCPKCDTLRTVHGPCRHQEENDTSDQCIPDGHYFKDDLDGGRLVKKDQLSPEQWAAGALPVHPHLRGAVIQAIREAVAEERDEILKAAKFILDEHCASKSEARGMRLIIGQIESRIIAAIK